MGDCKSKLCPGDPPGPPGPGIVDTKPSFDYIVRGHFEPQQNGDLKVREEQGSTDSIFLDDGKKTTDIES